MPLTAEDLAREIERKKQEASLKNLPIDPATGVGVGPVKGNTTNGSGMAGAAAAGGAVYGVPGAVIGAAASKLSPGVNKAGQKIQKALKSDTANEIRDVLTGNNWVKMLGKSSSAPAASMEGVQGAIGGVKSAGAAAGSIAQDLQDNPIQAQQVQGAQGLEASQADNPDSITPQQIQAQQIEAALAARAQLGPAATYGGAAINQDPQAQFRQQQADLALALQNQASGNAPSIAQMQLKQQGELAVQQQMAQAATMRGVNPAQANRLAAQNIANIQSQQAGQAGVLALQEQQAARAQLADVIGQGRQIDVGLATSQAGLDQQAGLEKAAAERSFEMKQADLDQSVNLADQAMKQDASKFNASTTLEALKANQTADLQAQVQNTLNSINTSQFNAKAQDEMKRFVADSQLRADVANQAANLQAQGMTLDNIAKQMGLEQDALKAVLATETSVHQTEQTRLTENTKTNNASKGGLISTAGAVIGTIFSDKNAKQNVEKSSKIGEFVNALTAYDYEYKKNVPVGEDKKRTGIMAQDLQKSLLGREMLSKDKDTGYLKFDTEKALQAALAGLAHLNKKIEGK